jgi:LysM repeat protein
MCKVYKVLQGDCMSSIAMKYGVLEETIWQFQQNSKLKSLRGSKIALLPGDLVHIPSIRKKIISSQTGKKISFVRKSIYTDFIMKFELNNGPRNDQLVRVEVDNLSVGDFTTDGDGILKLTIKADAKMVIVIFETDTHGLEKFEFSLGTIDPIDTVSGQKARLANLGFHYGDINDVDDSEFRQDILAFQIASRIEKTGSVDKVTQSKLEKLYGS